MLQYIHDINAYVEEQNKYGSDSVVLKLDEATNRVTVDLVDVYGNVIAGSTIFDETLSDLDTAIKVYNDVAEQLSEGDVIRHFNNPSETLRDPHDHDGNRYPSF